MRRDEMRMNTSFAVLIFSFSLCLDAYVNFNSADESEIAKLISI